jgi:acetyl esterase/lipase
MGSLRVMAVIWTTALTAVVGFGTALQSYSTQLPEPVFKDVPYASYASDANEFDLYLPDAKFKRPPLIVWIHGGAWRFGDKGRPQSLNRLLSEGFAVASINYRLSQEAIWPAQLEDVSAAIRMLRANADRLGFDGGRIALFGASAGGHLAASAGLAYAFDPTARVQAVVDYYGPSDLGAMGSDMAALGKISSLGPNGVANAPESLLIGGAVSANPDKALAASPTGFVQNLNVPPPPFLIMHGDQDEIVAPAQSARLHKRLSDKFGRGASDYVLVVGGTHGQGRFRNTIVENRMIAFLKAKLAAKH